MNRIKHHGLAGIVLLLGWSASGVAQNGYEQEPQFLRLKLTQKALLLEIEDQRKQTTYSGNSTDTKADTFSIEPGVELGATGSFYHPYLLEFSLNGSLSAQREDFAYEGFARENQIQDGTDEGLLQRYQVNATLLKPKPYAVHLTALRQEYDRDLDFFTREEVISDRYEIRSGYKTRPKELTAAYTRYTEDVTGQRISDREEHIFQLNAARRIGRFFITELDYTLRDVMHQRQQSTAQDGLVHELRLNDRRQLAGKDHIRLTSSANFSDRDTTTTPSRRMTWREVLRLQHRENLRSEYTYRLTDRSTGAADSRSHFSQGTLRHQLFESLTSIGDVQFQTTGDESRGFDSRFTRFGGGFDESYTKRIGTGSRLNLGVASHLFLNDEESSGNALQVIDEAVRLSDQSPSLLARPLVGQGSVVVTGRDGVIPFLRDLDYQLFPRGDFTEIRRVIGGAIPANSTVLVDYVAGGQPSEQFENTETSAYARYATFGDRLAIYGSLDDIQYYGTNSDIRQDLHRLTIGAEAGPRWSKTGIEYEDNDSSTFPYTSTRVFERLSTQLPGSSSASINISQQWRDFPESGQNEKTRSIIGNLRTHPFRFLSADFAAGSLQEDRATEDRDRITARASLKYRFGKLEVITRYDYMEDIIKQHLAEEEMRTEHRLWLRMKRNF